MSFPSSPERTIPSPTTLAIHLDLVGGLAGDMFVAGIVDAIPALAEPVLSELRAAKPPHAVDARFVDAVNGGIRARRFGLGSGGTEHAHGHSHADHSGTSYPELRHAIERAPIKTATRRHALALLALLGEAEATVHGVRVDDVHFHELADWDSLMDVVAAGAIAAELEGAHWSASLPPLGSGTIKTAHGILPVPAPATSLLLRGYPWRDDGIAGERITPTGAAILRYFVRAEACGAARSGGRLTSIGHGAGTRQLPGIPNVVRVLVSERAPSIDADAVTVIEFDVDDMTGEEIATAAEHLRARSGVIDVTIGSRIGKKARVAADFRLLVAPGAADDVIATCFTETSTLGLRVREERRRILPRREFATSVQGLDRSVKIAERPGGERTAKAAHDDVASASGLESRRRDRRSAERQVLDPDER